MSDIRRKASEIWCVPTVLSYCRGTHLSAITYLTVATILQHNP